MSDYDKGRLRFVYHKSQYHSSKLLFLSNRVNRYGRVSLTVTLFAFVMFTTLLLENYDLGATTMINHGCGNFGGSDNRAHLFGRHLPAVNIASSSIDLPASASIEGIRIVLPFSTTNCLPPVLITAYAISLSSQTSPLAIEKSIIIGISPRNGKPPTLIPPGATPRFGFWPLLTHFASKSAP